MLCCICHIWITFLWNAARCAVLIRIDLKFGFRCIFVKYFFAKYSINLLLNTFWQLLHCQMSFSGCIDECNSRSSTKVNVTRHLAHWCSFFVAACEDVGWVWPKKLCCFVPRFSGRMRRCATNSTKLIENDFYRSIREIRRTIRSIDCHWSVSNAWNQFIAILGMVLIDVLFDWVRFISIRNMRAPKINLILWVGANAACNYVLCIPTAVKENIDWFQLLLECNGLSQTLNTITTHLLRQIIIETHL